MADRSRVATGTAQLKLRRRWTADEGVDCVVDLLACGADGLRVVVCTASLKVRRPWMTGKGVDCAVDANATPESVGCPVPATLTGALFVRRRVVDDS